MFNVEFNEISFKIDRWEFRYKMGEIYIEVFKDDEPADALDVINVWDYKMHKPEIRNTEDLLKKINVWITNQRLIEWEAEAEDMEKRINAWIANQRLIEGEAKNV